MRMVQDVMLHAMPQYPVAKEKPDTTGAVAPPDGSHISILLLF